MSERISLEEIAEKLNDNKPALNAFLIYLVNDFKKLSERLKKNNEREYILYEYLSNETYHSYLVIKESHKGFKKDLIINTYTLEDLSVILSQKPREELFIFFNGLLSWNKTNGSLNNIVNYLKPKSP